MSAVANTFSTYDAKGVREDLSNLIYNISPTETPFMNNVGRGKATQTLTEWQTDKLAAADISNAKIEGDDLTAFSSTPATLRLGNYCQISRKDVILSDTDEAVDAAGRKSELSYQMAKRSAELKRDMEAILLANQAAAAGSSGVARNTGSILAWIKTNTVFGAGGANPTYTTVPTGTRTDGTQTANTEANVKSVLSQAWVSGGKPKLIMVGATQKQNFSTFAGVATKTFYQSAVKETAIIGAADVYVSDFGTLSIVPNRFQRARDVLVLDTEYWSIAYLRPFKTVPLAKTGDAEKRMIIVEYALKSHNEAASGIIADNS